MKILHVCAIAALISLFGLCSSHAAYAQSQPALGMPINASLPASKLTGLDPSLIDRFVAPCADLYHYANGVWIKRNSIPTDRAEWGIFSEAERRNLIALHEILSDAAYRGTGRPAPPHSVAIVGAFFRSGMNAAGIDAGGMTPLAPEFARIRAIRNVAALQIEIAHLHRIGVGAAFSFYVAADYKNSAAQIPQLYQGGLGMPDRDYYFKADHDSRRIRAAYNAHVRRMFVLMGDPVSLAKPEAGVVMRMETLLAGASMTQDEQIDPVAIYHRMDLRQVDSLTPDVEWATYFRAIGLPSPATHSYNVSQPKFLHQLGEMMASRTVVSWQDWRTYLRWQLVNGAAPHLSSPIEAEDFAFNQTTLQGNTTMRPRWERVEMVIDAEIGEALGRLYVERTFSPYAKEKARELVETVRAALRSRLQTVPWMSASTRAAAVAKCDAMLIKVGYPDKWRDYSALRISDQPYVLNVFAANEFEFQRNLSKIGKPTDRAEWDMTPPTINADYDDSTNSINIPAAILQAPFFDPSYDDAVNYGELGATVGHEMTHGFDNTGRLFDASGNLHNWWTPADASSFKTHAAQIVAQYAAYEPLPGVHIDGDLSLTENIADIGGLKLAYLALEQDLQHKPQTPIDGFTPEQRYFISYAQGWRDLMRPALERELLVTDPHSPPQYRVIGPCGDMPEFYKAFGVPVPNSAMKAGVW